MRANFRTVLLLLAVFVGACAGERPGIISGDEFAAQYADTLRRSEPEADVRITGPLELSVELAGESFFVFLDNAYASYRAEPERLQEVVEDYAGRLLETGRQASTGFDPSRIVPVIKGSDYLDAFARSRESGRNSAPVPPPAFDRYNEHLIVLYAEDQPRAVRFLYERELADAGISRDTLLELAVENLRALLPDIETVREAGLYLLVADGIYESSLLLFDDLWIGDTWRSGRLKLAGEPVVAVPTRNLLLVADSRNLESVALLRELANRMSANEPYPVASQLFIYRDGRFRRFDG
ncbi:MAG: DUF1444 family protein [Inquilinus sp.]|nr:DUF1444 family protein [Inquilinus sp.]